MKRIEYLKDFADFCSTEYKSILKHCETQWLFLTWSIKRILEMWEPLCSYFFSHPDVENPGKVKTIVGLLSQPPTKAWLLFLSNILAVFDKFNAFLQTSSTSTIYKYHGESEHLLKQVIRVKKLVGLPPPPHSNYLSVFLSFKRTFAEVITFSEASMLKFQPNFKLLTLEIGHLVFAQYKL